MLLIGVTKNIMTILLGEQINASLLKPDSLYVSLKRNTYSAIISGNRVAMKLAKETTWDPGWVDQRLVQLS